MVALPAAPAVISPVNYCIGTTAVALTATVTGTNTLLWYTTATGGTGSAIAPTPSTATAGTTSYWVSQVSSAPPNCESLRSKIDVVVVALPAAPVVTSTINYCVGATAVPLTATVTGTNTLLWYTTATGGTGSTTAPLPSTATSGTTSYYVSQTNGAACEGPRAVIVVNVNALPAAPTVAPIDCSLGFGNAIVTVTSPTGAGLEYSLDGGPFQLGTSFTGVANGSHIVTLRNPAGCTTTGTSFTVACGCASGPTITLSSITGSTCSTIPVTVSANTFSNATTVTITENGAGTVSPVFANLSPFIFTYTPGVGDAGNAVIITVATDNPLGPPCAAATVTYTLTVNALPAVPTVVSPVTYCEGAIPVGLTAAGTNLFWYTVPTGGTGSSTAPIPSTAMTGTTSYYVSQTNGASCEGPRAEIVVNVNGLPAAPTVSTPVHYCVGSIAAPLTAIGTNLLWYTTATGGTGSPTAPIPSTATAGTTSFYVSQTNGASCEGPRAEIVVTVNALPASPTVGPIDCTLGSGNAVVTVTSPVGTGMEYSLDGGVFQTGVTFSGVGNGSHIITVKNAEGCTTTGSSFTVACGCVGGPALSLSSISGSTCGVIPVTINGNIFSNATTVTLTTNGAGSVNPVSATISPFTFTYIPSVADAGNTVIITITTNNPTGPPCTIAIATYTLMVNAVPAAPIVTTPITYCQGATAVALAATGTNLLWYTTPAGGTGSTTPPTPSTATAGTTSYYVSQRVNGCEGPRAQMDVAVAANLSPSFTAVPSICSGATLAPLPTTSANGISGTWSPALNNTTTTIYTFTPSTGQCAIPATLLITVNQNSTPAFEAIGPLCQHATAPALPAISTNGIAGTWNPSTINTAVIGTTTYTFTPSGNQCATTATLAIVITAPVTPAFTPISPMCQNSTAPTLPITSSNGITGTWAPATVSTVTPGTITHTFTPANGQCAIPVTMNIVITPQIPAIRYSDVTAFPNTPIQLSARNIGVNYLWTPGAGLSSTTISTPVFTYNQQTEYRITIVATGGCTITDTLLVKMTAMKADILVPKAWSPNGDGHNDKLFLYGVNLQVLRYFRVFNRWGQLVFETNTISHGWDGVFKGMPQAIDTYKWIVEGISNDGQIIKRSGNSVLLR